MSITPTRNPADLGWTASLRRRRVKVPTVLQMEATECGAACLGMVLAHNGRWVPLEDLRVACGVSRDGANAHSIVLAGRANGMRMDGFRRDLDQLPEEPFPVIAFWRFSHFVVIEGVSGRGLYLNDPALGRTTVEWQEADRDFTGVVLHAEPGPDFRREGHAPSAWQGLRTRVEGAWRAIAYLLIVCLALAIPVALGPTAIQGYVDKVVVAGLPEWIPTTLATLLFAGAMTFWLTVLQGSATRRLSLALSQSQAVQLVSHALRLPMSFFVQRYVGDVAFRVQLVDDVSQLAAMQLIPAAAALVTAVAVGVTIFSYSWPLALLGSIGAIAVAMAMRASASWRRSAAARLAREQASFSGALAYGLRSIETVKASGTEEDLFVMASGRHARTVNALTRLQVSTMSLASLPTLVSSLTAALTICLGGLLVMADRLSPGGFVAVLALLPLFLGPIGAWAALSTTVQQTRASLDRLDDLLDHPVDPMAVSGDTGPSPGPVTGNRRRAVTYDLELHDVSFGYNPTAPRPLIEGVSIGMNRGERIGVVGASGCGKSTLGRLAVGLMHPWSGTVLLHGVPLGEVARSERVAHLGYVDQEIVLFPGTVRDNITLFDPTISDQAVIAAARAAGIHEEIAARHGGYDSPVAEGGSNFSGGQRQRIELARAVAAGPEILVLDEATSALDPIKEAEVMAALEATGAGLLVIAHRLSTVRDCDPIIVLSDGAIVERGTHAELLDRGGFYAGMVAL